ncbi:ionotropic receptor 21a-like [Schistocerca americana]|uniref:ionotropic receptor 21a-like n=1 Tax=Schistocerca americana TaxID=7009 RepID=UPI001F4FE6FD|nr:ionotropic receptor 21a-like [Schistocerca americana]
MDDIYYDKFMNLNGNDVRASMFTVNPSAIEDNTTVSKFRGCDAQMTETLAKYMNANLVMLPNDGSGFGKWNGTVNTGTDGDVMFERADIAPNTRYIIVERLKVHGYTYPHDKEDLCILVNKSSRIPQYLNIILPFAIIAWMTILLSMPFTAFFWSLIRHFGNGSSRVEKFAYVYINSFLKIFSVFLSIAVPSLPSVGRERILFVMWTFFSLIITNTFQGSLTSYLTIPKYMPDIDTMEQLSRSGLKILIHPELLPVFKLDTGNPVIDALNRNLIPDIDMEGYPEKIQSDGGTCALVNAYVGQFLIRSRHYVRNGFPLLHLTKECPLPAVVAFATQKYSPLQPRFDSLIRRIVEAGLYKKWQKNTLDESIAAGDLLLISNREGKADTERITMSHLQMPFYLLFLGYFLSSVLFFTEAPGWGYARRGAEPLEVLGRAGKPAQGGRPRRAAPRRIHTSHDGRPAGAVRHRQPPRGQPQDAPALPATSLAMDATSPLRTLTLMLAILLLVVLLSFASDAEAYMEVAATRIRDRLKVHVGFPSR